MQCPPTLSLSLQQSKVQSPLSISYREDSASVAADNWISSQHLFRSLLYLDGTGLIPRILRVFVQGAPLTRRRDNRRISHFTKTSKNLFFPFVYARGRNKSERIGNLSFYARATPTKRLDPAID